MICFKVAGCLISDDAAAEPVLKLGPESLAEPLGAASELATGSNRERTPATSGLIFLSLVPVVLRKQKDGKVTDTGIMPVRFRALPGGARLQTAVTK